MLFSVIIPTYNRLGFLKHALASVWTQTFTDYETIVVDDGSTDGTAEWLAAEPRVRLFRQSNQGPGAARNLGAREARGAYLAFLDSDDLWFPWTLSTYAKAIGEAGKPAFVAGAPFQFEDAGCLPRAAPDKVQCRVFADYLASGDEWRWWGVSSFVVRADFFRERGGFREVIANGEDADLALRLGDAPGFVQIMSPPTFGYRNHLESLVADEAKSIAGAWHSVRAEEAGRYPGGSHRARERWRILTRHTRPVAVACLKSGRVGEAWSLYRATWRWHCALGRWKFVLGFPPLALMHNIRERL